jgi:ABC-2 type transport system ATP-binding protein
VLNAEITDHNLFVSAPEADEILAPVVTQANEIGVKIHSVDIQEANLEAIFLHLTGRALRD